MSFTASKSPFCISIITDTLFMICNSSKMDRALARARTYVLTQELRPLVLRRGAAALTKYLPPKYEWVLHCRLSDMQTKLYRAFVRDRLKHVYKLQGQVGGTSQDCNGAEPAATNHGIIAAYHHSLAIVNHPDLLFDCLNAQRKHHLGTADKSVSDCHSGVEIYRPEARMTTEQLNELVQRKNASNMFRLLQLQKAETDALLADKSGVVSFEVELTRTGSSKFGLFLKKISAQILVFQHPIENEQSKTSVTILSGVERGSVADRLGRLLPGDVLIAVNGKSFCNLNEACALMRTSVPDTEMIAPNVTTSSSTFHARQKREVISLVDEDDYATTATTPNSGSTLPRQPEFKQTIKLRFQRWPRGGIFMSRLFKQNEQAGFLRDCALPSPNVTNETTLLPNGHGSGTAVSSFSATSPPPQSEFVAAASSHPAASAASTTHGNGAVHCDEVEFVESSTESFHTLGWAVPLLRNYTKATVNSAELSGKVMVLFSILRTCRKVGDKVLIFSQSVKTLDVIQTLLNEQNTLLQHKSQPGLRDIKASMNKCSTATLSSETSEAVVSNNRVPKPKYGCSNSKRTDGEIIDQDTPQSRLLLDEPCHCLRVDGSTPQKARVQRVNQFNESRITEYAAMLLSTRAAGEGINLQSANRVVLFDTCWNPQVLILATV